MAKELFATRLASRMQVPNEFVGAVGGVMALANLCSTLVSDSVAFVAAIVVAAIAAPLFFCASFDPRFNNALSALNAGRHPQTSPGVTRPRFIGWGPRLRDRVLFCEGLALIAVFTLAGSIHPHPSAAVLSFAAFFLLGMTHIALAVRGYPDDQFLLPRFMGESRAPYPRTRAVIVWPPRWMTMVQPPLAGALIADTSSATVVIGWALTWRMKSPGWRPRLAA